MHRAVCRTERCTLHRTLYRMRASERATRSAPHEARGCTTTDTAALAAAASRGAQGAAAEGAVRRARAPDQPVPAARGDADRDPSAQRRARPASVSPERRAPVPTRLTCPPPGAAARPPVSRPDLFVHLRERPGAQPGSSATVRPRRATAAVVWARVSTRGTVLGCSSQVRRVTQKPGSRHQRQRDVKRQTTRPPDHRSTRPPVHRASGPTRSHSSACACIAHPLTPSPTQVSLKAEGEAAATKLELRSKRFAGFTHALHDLQPRPAEKKIVCVCAPRQPPGGAAACQRRGSCTRAARESRGAGSPRLPAATAGSGRCGADLPKLAGHRLPTLRHSAPPAGSCSSARTPTAPPTWPPTCNRHGAIYYPLAAYTILSLGLAHTTLPTSP